MMSGLQRWLLRDLSGRATAILAGASLAWGWLILEGLPFWARMEAAQGRAEIQTRYHTAAELELSLGQLGADAPTDAAIFYLLDVPNAFLLGLSLAALLRFGLRLWGRDRAPYLGVVFLPLICMMADLAENATLAAGLSLTPDVPNWLLVMSSALTTVKLASGQAAIMAILALVFSGLARSALRRFRARRMR